MRDAEDSRDTGWGQGRSTLRSMGGRVGEGMEAEIKEPRAPQACTAEKSLATL